MIRLSVPGTLLHRDLVLRVVASSCKLLRKREDRSQEPSHADDHTFDNEVVSAVGEVFNNIAIHGYAGETSGTVELEFELVGDELRIRMADTGKSFDLGHDTATELPALPESHMGLFIVRSFMDDVRYLPREAPDRPNVFVLTKRYVRR